MRFKQLGHEWREREMMSKLAIGMPVYERTEYLAEAFKSLKNQTYCDFIVFFSDNCSSTNLKKVFDDCVGDDPRFIYNRLENSVPIAENFWRTFYNTNSRFFMWAADDDRWHPNFVAAAIEKLESEEHPDAWFCNIESINGDGAISRNHFSLQKFSSTEHKNLDLLRYIFEPEFMGKANLFYSVFAREALASEIERWRKTGLDFWGSDIVFIFGFLSRFSIFIDERVMFQKRNPGAMEYARILKPRFYIYPSSQRRAYFHGYVAAVDNKALVRLALVLRCASDVIYKMYIKLTFQKTKTASPMGNGIEPSF